ncbi:hypothetical protein LCGC14_1004270 [marine sediment metagenome]|uniref:RNA ligase domain-containing protein n=1 Tax=marine sediment metagenome TaxID=412755 RepID=A0A0F9N269_9ZZZZ
MKTYPSLLYPPKNGLGERLHTFEKLDGSNLRFEWSKKKGWYKAGTRRRLLDETDDIFGPAPALFQSTLADECTKIAKKQQWQRVVVFCEYYGHASFAGLHQNQARDMKLTVIDVAPYRMGLLPPTEFLKLFGHVGPRYLGYLKWGKNFIERVRRDEIEGASFEGVVGKTMRGRKPLLYKAKTQQWRDRVRALYTPQEADKILAS